MSDTYSLDQQAGQRAEKTFVHHPLIPYDPNVWLYVAQGSVVVPFEWTNWRDETMAGKESCSIHASLNPQPTFRIKGPEALKFLSDVCVNDFTTFPIGSAKHAIMCNEEGLDMGDGVLMRLGEDEFLSYEMGANYIAYVFQTGQLRRRGRGPDRNELPVSDRRTAVSGSARDGDRRRPPRHPLCPFPPE